MFVQASVLQSQVDEHCLSSFLQGHLVAHLPEQSHSVPSSGSAG